MKYNVPFSTQVRSGRKDRSLTLRTLAAEVGITHQQLSRIELGYQEPESSVRARLAARLSIVDYGTGSNRRELKVDYRELEAFRDRERFPIVPQYSTQKRVNAAFAVYPKLMRTLSPRLPQWGRQFLRRVICDSGLEALSLFRWLVTQPQPALARLLALGFRRHPIVHPNVEKYGICAIADHKFAALIVGDMLLVFQVPMLAGSSVYVLDVLIKWQGRWFDLEIDGVGHPASRDADRARDLLMPVLRVTEQDVVADDFVERVKNKLRLAART